MISSTVFSIFQNGTFDGTQEVCLFTDRIEWANSELWLDDVIGSRVVADAKLRIYSYPKDKHGNRFRQTIDFVSNYTSKFDKVKQEMANWSAAICYLAYLEPNVNLAKEIIRGKNDWSAPLRKWLIL